MIRRLLRRAVLRAVGKRPAMGLEDYAILVRFFPPRDPPVRLAWANLLLERGYIDEELFCEYTRMDYAGPFQP